MKALTLHQPWASLIAVGAKQIETRSWATKYRGPFAIHAGRRTFDTMPYFDRELYRFADALGLSDIFSFDQLPYGAVIAIADLFDCVEMTTERIFAWKDAYGPDEIAFGHFEPGRYAWILANVRAIEPVPAKGKQGLWNWEG